MAKQRKQKRIEIRRNITYEAQTAAFVQLTHMFVKFGYNVFLIEERFNRLHQPFSKSLERFFGQTKKHARFLRPTPTATIDPTNLENKAEPMCVHLRIAH